MASKKKKAAKKAAGKKAGKAAKKKPAKKAAKKAGKKVAKKAGKKATKKAGKKATKKASKKVAKKASKKVAKKGKRKASGKKRTPNAAFMRPVTPSEALSAVVGAKPMPRTEVTKKLWDYIKKNNLQDPQNKRSINADDKLKPIFKKPAVDMMEMSRLVAKHLS